MSDVLSDADLRKLDPILFKLWWILKRSGCFCSAPVATVRKFLLRLVFGRVTRAQMPATASLVGCTNSREIQGYEQSSAGKPQDGSWVLCLRWLSRSSGEG